MIDSLNMHRIERVSLKEIVADSVQGRDYYSRVIVFESTRCDGTPDEFRITLFSDNGHNLLISDAELDAMLKEPEKVAA